VKVMTYITLFKNSWVTTHSDYLFGGYCPSEEIMEKVMNSYSYDNVSLQIFRINCCSMDLVTNCSKPMQNRTPTSNLTFSSCICLPKCPSSGTDNC
jgi:hypothetical protein